MSSVANILSEVSTFYSQLKGYYDGVSSYISSPGTFPLEHFQDINLTNGDVCGDIAFQFANSAVTSDIGTIHKIVYDIASLKREAVGRTVTKAFLYSQAELQTQEIGKGGVEINTIRGTNPDQITGI